MPKQFPPAAELMIARLELMLAEHLVAAVGSTSGRAPDAEMPEITAMRRDGSLISLSPLMRTPLAMLNLEVDDGGVLPWLMTVAMPFTTLARIFGYAEKEREFRPVNFTTDPAQGPFSEVPITISAVLVDMRVPFPSIASLAPGVVLPVAVSRHVPLRVGNEPSRMAPWAPWMTASPCKSTKPLPMRGPTHEFPDIAGLWRPRLRFPQGCGRPPVGGTGPHRHEAERRSGAGRGKRGDARPADR
jgi:hypothetical protein